MSYWLLRPTHVMLRINLIIFFSLNYEIRYYLNQFLKYFSNYYQLFWGIVGLN